MDNLQTILLDNHPYIGHYRHAYELIREKPVEEQEEITIRLHVNLQQDQRTHNLPTAKEIAVIIPEEGVNHALDNRCKGTPPFLPLNNMTTLQSYLSLFN